MNNIVSRLIAEERKMQADSDRGARAAFRVCEKLRQPLSILTGTAGFRSLISRALVLARRGTPILMLVQIDQRGSLEYSPELDAKLDSAEAAEGATNLATQLVLLLIIFIGEALTLRLVQDVWPNAAVEESHSGEKPL